MLSKTDAFFDCLAARIDDETGAEWFDKMSSNKSAGAYIDQANDNGKPIGPATMAQQVVDYLEGRIDMPAWMQMFNK